MNVNNNNARRGNARQENNNARPPRLIHNIPIEVEINRETPETLLIGQQNISLSNQRTTIEEQQVQINDLRVSLTQTTGHLRRLLQFQNRAILQNQITKKIKNNINDPRTKDIMMNALERSGIVGRGIITVINNHNNTPQDPLSDKIQTHLTKHVTETDLEMIQNNILATFNGDHQPPRQRRRIE